jgi:hypothetical protein
VSYLIIVGLGLLIVAEPVLQLLGATGSYPPEFVRFGGAFMLVVAFLVFQVVRHRVEAFYAYILIARLILLGTFIWLYVSTNDFIFLVFTGVLGLGMVLTGLGLIADRQR